MNRSIAIWGAIALAGLGCDDAASKIRFEAPDWTCTEVVLQDNDSAITRCADGARFSWIVAGHEVLSERTVGLVAGGVEVLGHAWPQVSWQVKPDEWTEKQRLHIKYAGRPDLPDLTVRLALYPAGAFAFEPHLLTVEVEVVADGPVALDALVMFSGGAMPSGHLLGPDGLIPAGEADPRMGNQVWVSDRAPLTAWNADRGLIASDGAIRRTLNAELSAGARLEGRSNWYVSPRGFAVLRPWSRWIRPANARFGWRTGPTHGAVVDPAAIAAEMAILRTHHEEPMLVIDGLWSAAIGDWRSNPALDGLSDKLALWTPIDRVCPDAPGFADTDDASFDTADPCRTLNPARPAAQAYVREQLAAFQNVSLHADNSAFCDQYEVTSVGSAVPPTDCRWQNREVAMRFDRLLGSPGATCYQAAFEGPFPRSATCETALSTLEEAASAPLVPPHDGASILMAHSDLETVAPMPLTLSGPEGPARQRLMLNVIGDAPLLIADAPSQLTSQAFDWIKRLSPVDETNFQPRLEPGEWPPAVWDSNHTMRIFFNWTDAPRVFPLDPVWHGGPDLLSDGVYATDVIEVPPHDVRLMPRTDLLPPTMLLPPVPE